MMSMFPVLRSIVPTPSIPFYIGPSNCGISLVSLFPSISIPRVTMPIPSTSMPTSGSLSSGGQSFGFSMGSGSPSTSSNNLCGPISSSPVYLLGGICLVVLGLSLVRPGEIVHQEVLTFHGLSHLSLGLNPLEKIFHHGEIFPLLTHPVLGVSSLVLALRIFFLEGPHFPLGEIPLGEYLVLGVDMLLEVPPFLEALTLQKILKSPSGVVDTSPST
jgi:hypothetical protein